MRALAPFLLAILVASVADAQPELTGAGGTSVSAATVYAGPGDVVSGAKAWYGLRAYTLAIANAGTQKLFDAIRTSDSQTCSFLVASNGGVGNSTSCSGAFGTGSLSTFCNATTCSVSKLYDQSGNGFDVTQATVAKQPTIVLNCLGSLPCMQFARASLQALYNATISTTIQPYTFSFVSLYTDEGNANLHDVIANYNGTAAAMDFTQGGTNNFSIYAGNAISFTVTDSAWNNYQIDFNSTSSVVNINGTETSSINPGNFTADANIAIGDFPNVGRQFNGKVVEAGFWASNFTGTQRTNMCHQQFVYWGTSTSC
jgi:hypothetical protein